MIVSGALLAAATGGAEIPDPDFLRTYAETFRLSLGHPTAVAIADDGSRVFFLRSGGRDPVRDLFVFEVASGDERLLANAAELLGGEREELTAEEKARRERQRLTARGIARFWPMDGGDRLLVPLSGRLFVIETTTGGVKSFDPPAGAPVDPRPSPDGRNVGYVVDGDFYLLDLATGEQRRLTRKENESVTYGLAEFVAQEEMDRDEGFWFSPDGTRVAVQRTDTATVGTLYLADAMHPDRAPRAAPYPRPGEANADVRLAIYATAGGAAPPIEVEWDRARYPYLTRVKWKDHGPLTVVVQNRLQTELEVLAVDPATGASRRLLVERDPAWLELDDAMPHWLAGGRGFLWSTEREGAKQVELRSPDGARVRPLTDVDLGYRAFVHADADAMVIEASDDPTTRHAWRVPLDGGQPVQLTAAEGVHGVDVSRDGSLHVRNSAAAAGEKEVAVTDRDGKVLATLVSRAVDLGYAPTTEWLTVGEQQLRAAVTRPRDFDPARVYPVIVHVYAGPTSLMVQRTRSRYHLTQWIADHGFIVASIDGRGTPYRSRAWQRSVKGDLITKPLADQVAGLEALAARLPEMDRERVGIFGWSFGGYAAAMAVMQRGDLFKAAVAGAPVTDWQDYDTHYTERYLGLPQETPEAYRVSNVLTYAPHLDRPLMIVHGTADDNVIFVHALKMSNALFRAGKPHEFVPLSGLTHMLAEPEVVESLYGRIIAFFKRHLGTPAPISD